MQFPKSLHAEGWRARMPARALPPMPMVSHDPALDGSAHAHRRLHVLAIAVVAAAALAVSASLNVVDDPRPLDVQLSSGMHQAGDMLKNWQAQLSHGLQVSLRAVADGDASPHETVALMDEPPAAGRTSEDAAVPAQPERAAVDALDSPPARADLAARRSPMEP